MKYSELIFAFALFKFVSIRSCRTMYRHSSGNKEFKKCFILFRKIQLKMLVPYICICRSLHYNLRSSRYSLQHIHLFFYTHSTFFSRTSTFVPKPSNVLLRKAFLIGYNRCFIIWLACCSLGLKKAVTVFESSLMFSVL